MKKLNINKRFLTKRIISILGPVLTPIIALSALSILVTRRIEIQELTSFNSSTIKGIQILCDNKLNEAIALSLNYSNNPSISIKIKNILKNDVISYYDFQTLRNIESYLASTVSSSKDIDSIYLYIENSSGRFLATNGISPNIHSFRDIRWLETYFEKKEDDSLVSWVDIREVRENRDTGPYRLITIFRKIIPSGARRSEGVILINLHLNSIWEYLGEITLMEGQKLYVLSENGSVVFPREKEDLSQDILTGLSSGDKKIRLNHEHYFVNRIHSGTSGWTYVSLVPVQNTFLKSSALMTQTIIIVLISIILGSLIIVQSVRTNFRNLQQSVELIYQAENDHISLPDVPRFRNEYDILYHNVYQALEKLNHFRTKLKNEEYRSRDLEQRFLQSQINPHFLNNVLEVIYWQTIKLTGKPNEVSLMMENLSQLLQYSLEKTSKPVTLRDEIENTKSYLSLAKMIYNCRFSIVWEYSEPILSLPSLKLLIQPIVENSIIHGFRTGETGQEIRILFREEGSDIVLEIVDNGTGMADNDLSYLQNRLLNTTEQDGEDHIGLINTNLRISSYYRTRNPLTIRNNEGPGCTVTVRIPGREMSSV